MKYQRLLALLILIIPGAIGVYGWTIMRDMIYEGISTEDPFPLGMFLLGLFLFILGIAFIGGFIFFRDKKRKRVQDRFLDDLDDENA